MANIIPITSFSAPELDVFARLTENQLVNRADPANAMFIAESPLVIGRALDGGCVPLSFLMETKHVEGKAAEILSRCPEDIPVYTAELDVLTQLTGFKLTRGMLCAMRGFEKCCGSLHKCAPHCRARKCDESHEHRRNLPQCSGARHGRGFIDRRRQRPAVSPREPREHGHGISGAVDVSARRRLVAGYAARSRL